MIEYSQHSHFYKAANSYLISDSSYYSDFHSQEFIINDTYLTLNSVTELRWLWLITEFVHCFWRQILLSLNFAFNRMTVFLHVNLSECRSGSVNLWWNFTKYPLFYSCSIDPKAPLKQWTRCSCNITYSWTFKNHGHLNTDKSMERWSQIFDIERNGH